MKKNMIEMVMACLLLVSFFFLSKEAAKTVQQMNASDVNNVILVDAGHGGDDPGMIGVNGLEEKGINLSISEKLRKSLEKKGFKVIMTREEDKGLYEENSRNQKAQDLQNRIALISRYKPVLSVSIHQNSYTDPAVYGPQVFYYKDSVEGEKLAQALQAQLNDQLKVKRPRSPKGDRTYYLLKRSQGVLNIVECGFLTNPSEASLLQTEEYQEKVAQAVTDGICNYLDKN